MIFKNRKIKSLIAKAKTFERNRVQNPPKPEMIAKELKVYHALIAIYSSLITDKKFPFAKEMVRETQRAAIALEDSNAAFQLAESLLEEAKFREQLEKEGLFSSSINQKYMKQLFEEAHAYLKVAQELGSFQAKRLAGVCYIRGWGVPMDRNKGFDLVVASIEQENSWDKVPEIFAAIAKDDPALFAALMKHRAKS